MKNSKFIYLLFIILSLFCFFLFSNCSNNSNNAKNRQVFETTYGFHLTDDYTIKKFEKIHSNTDILDIKLAYKNKIAESKLIEHLRLHFSKSKIKDSAKNQFTIQADSPKKWVTIIVTSKPNNIIEISSVEESRSLTLE